MFLFQISLLTIFWLCFPFFCWSSSSQPLAMRQRKLIKGVSVQDAPLTAQTRTKCSVDALCDKLACLWQGVRVPFVLHHFCLLAVALLAWLFDVWLFVLFGFMRKTISFRWQPTLINVTIKTLKRHPITDKLHSLPVLWPQVFWLSYGTAWRTTWGVIFLNQFRFSKTVFCLTFRENCCGLEDWKPGEFINLWLKA